MEQFLSHRIPALPSPKNASEWAEQEQRLRKHVLDDVAFHGWPADWVHSDPKFQEMGVIQTGNGYRVRKFRYEVVPGLESTALLYEPEKTTGRAPAILNLLGHEPMGNAVSTLPSGASLHSAWAGSVSESWPLKATAMTMRPP
jgi:hypothetical protein